MRLSVHAYMRQGRQSMPIRNTAHFMTARNTSNSASLMGLQMLSKKPQKRTNLLQVALAGRPVWLNLEASAPSAGR